MKSLDIAKSNSLKWEQSGKLASRLVAGVEISGASASKGDVLPAILSWYVVIPISDYDYDGGGEHSRGDRGFGNVADGGWVRGFDRRN